MLNLPNTPVFNKIQANNARIAPNESTNTSVSEHKHFSMLHPQRASETTLMGVLDQLDLSNPTQQTNGVMKGQNKECSGDYMITPGVIKFKPGHITNTPPSVPGTTYNPPVAEGPPVETPSYPPAGQIAYTNILEQPMNQLA